MKNLSLEEELFVVYSILTLPILMYPRQPLRGNFNFNC